MDLESAIKHCEERAEDLRKEGIIKQNRNNPNESVLADRCIKCAEEHEQLAEWLKDYKRLLENNSELKELKLTTITTSDGKEYDIENDCLIRKSEAIKLIYEKGLKINNPDTQNGLCGAVAILWDMVEEGE